MRASRSGTLALALACGGQAAAPDDGGAPDGGAPPPATVSVAFPLEPGEEVTRCVDVRVPIDAPMDVHAIRASLNDLSHHLIVYRSAATQERPEPFGCPPFLEAFLGVSLPMLGVQSSSTEVTLPEGVAYRFEPGQMVRLEVHAINYATERREVRGEVTFTGLPPGAREAYADMIFYGTIEMHLPAGEETVTGPLWLPGEPDVNIFGMAGHTHRFGTDVTIEKARAADGPGELLYRHDDWSWQEPPTDLYDPPITFAEGEGLRLTCTHVNTTDEDLGFGKSANEEMCFVFGYYYPAQGPRLCIETENFSGCCPPGNLLSCLGKL